MPGLQLASFWEGNRAELFATYALSSVAAVVNVPRPFDFGLDLLCTLTHQDNNLLHAGKAFGVQVKAASAQKVQYGGLDAKKRKWKKHEIDWLFGQDQPIILCIVDLKQWRVRLYSTIPIWWLRWMRGPNLGEVVLEPDLEADSSKSRGYSRTQLELGEDDLECGDGYSHSVPLGKPIFDIELKQQETKEYRDNLRLCLDRWLELDYRNIIHYRMQVPFTSEWADWEPNTPPGPVVKFRHYHNSMPDKNIYNILSSMAPASVALFRNLEVQGQHAKLKHVLPIMRLMNAYGVPEPAIPTILEDQDL